MTVTSKERQVRVVTWVEAFSYGFLRKPVDSHLFHRWNGQIGVLRRFLWSLIRVDIDVATRFEELIEQSSYLIGQVREMFHEDSSFIRCTVDVKCTSIEYFHTQCHERILIGIELSVDIVDGTEQRWTINRTMIDEQILTISRRST